MFALGARHYYRGEFEQAQQVYTRSFYERNWISVMHKAYTMPLTGRSDEARAAVQQLLTLYPGFTIERGLQFYRGHCFKDTYLINMQTALLQAGLPSQLGPQLLDKIQVPPVRVQRVNGYPLEYRDIGSGEPIVFVHGALSDFRVFADVELPITARHRCIAYSQRCFGSQPDTCSAPPASFQVPVDDLVAFIESLNPGPVHLVTYSMGFKIAAAAAATRPELIKSMVHFEPVAEALAAEQLNTATSAARD